MSRAWVLLGFLISGAASAFPFHASAEPYPLPEERTRQNLNEATISADVIRALPDPEGVLSGKGSVSVREYDELIRKLMDEYIGDDAISVDAFLAPYPEEYKERFPQKLLISEMRRVRDETVTYACKQEDFYHAYLMEFLPSNMNDAETLRHHCNALEADSEEALKDRDNKSIPSD